MKKKLIILSLILIFTVLGVNFFFTKKSPPPSFSEVKRADLQSIISSSGTLAGKQSVSLKFKSAGKLAYVNVKTGDTVSSGYLVAGLDTGALANTLQQAENTYRDKQATAQKIEDDVKDHSSDETFAQRATRTTAQAARDSAYDSVKEARRAFQDAVLTSPISGVVTQAISTSGQNVSTSDVIAQVVDFSKILFDTDIDEADIGKISLGQSAQVKLDAFPDKTFKGIVSEIIPQTKTTSTGATVVTVRIDLGNPAITPINGLTGQADIILSEVKNVLSLPIEAVREDSVVFIQDGKSVRMQKVETGLKSDTEVEIRKGLSEGQKVLTTPLPAATEVSRNPLQNILFRVFGGRGGSGGFNRR